MTRYTDPQEVVNEFTSQLNKAITDQVKVLLEQKHLYQRVSVDPQLIRQAIMAPIPKEQRATIETSISKILRGRITLSTGSFRTVPFRHGEPEIVMLGLTLLNVRLFCVTCDGVMVFRPIWYRDVSNEIDRLAQPDFVEVLTGDVRTNQLFFITLQCQHCKGLPEGIIIRREGWKFSLDGRAPTEHIAVPDYIPKPETHLYRDSLIGWYAGKKLAAVFYLRAFIEQFARRQTKVGNQRKTGDEIMEAYADILPADKKSSMPSLRKLYDTLNEPIHSADEDQAEAIFETAKADIEQHFEIRRAFRIPEIT